MASAVSNNIGNENNNVKFKYNKTGKMNRRGRYKSRPASFMIGHKDKDRLRNNDFFTKTRIGIEKVFNMPSYVQRGLKGDPDFNFFEALSVSKIPYYVGGLGLASMVLAGRNNFSPSAKFANNTLFKKILSGVLMYYVGREAANLVIDAPVKWFRGIDLNHPYKKVTALREGNPLNLPNNKKQGSQKVFESAEFTRWDLLYKYNGKKGINETFDALAKKFGATGKQKDSDSRVKRKIQKLIIMATSWKTMLSVPFVTMGLGLAQQNSFADIDVRSLFKNTINLFKPTTSNRFAKLFASVQENVAKPVANSFKELWRGNSLASRIFGRGSIIASLGLAVLANKMILDRTSLKEEPKNFVGGNK